MPFFKRLHEVVVAKQLTKEKVDELVAWIKDDSSNTEVEILVQSDDNSYVLAVNGKPVKFGDYIKKINTEIFPEGGFIAVGKELFENNHSPIKKGFYKRIPHNLEAILFTPESKSQVVSFAKKSGFDVVENGNNLIISNGIELKIGEYVLCKSGNIFGIREDAFLQMYKQMRKVPAKHSLQ